MSFNAFKSSMLAALVAVGALSCTPKVGEQAPPPKQQEFSGTACLTEATDYAELFLKGEAKDPQVAAAWDCFTGAFQAFEKYVRGGSKDSYTAAEISSFIENEFIARRPDGSIHAIPPTLQAELMKLKKLVAGGNAEVITRSEIRSVINKFGRLRELSLKLNPYMKLLVMKWRPEDLAREVSAASDIEHFEKANSVLQDVASEVGRIIEANQSSYRLDDVTVFLRELSSYLGKDWELTSVVSRFLPLAKKLKRSLTGGREDEILSTEWRLVIVTTLRSYVQYLRYYYFVELPPNVGREQRLTSFSRIVEESFSIVEGLVREKADGAVSRQEIDEIVAVLSEAWPAFKSSRAMLDEVMKIKKLLFGGSTDRIAASDFELARLKVSRIRDLIDLLAPYARIYSGDWTGGARGGTEASRAEFDRAGAALDRAAQEFGGLLEVGDKDAFDLKGILVLAKEMNRLYPPQGGKGFGRTLETYFPLLQSLKNMVYGDKDSLVRKAQWPSLLSFGSRVYTTSLYYVYFIKDEDSRQAGTLRRLQTLVNRGLDLGQQMVDTNPKHYFPLSDVAKVVGAVGDLDLLPDGLNRRVLTDLLKPVLNRLLNPPEKRLAGQRPEALRQSSLEQIRTEFMIWAQTAEFLAQTFGGSDQKTMRAAELQAAISRGINGKSSSALLKTGLKELAAIFDTGHSLVLDREKRVYISVAGRLKYNFRTVERHNLLRAVSRLFVASYANDLGRIRRYQGVTKSEANTAFRDFRGVGVALGFLDPKNTGFMDSRFREANMFMPRSDGNSLASFIEIHEIAFSIMSGLVLDSKMKYEFRTCAGARQGRVGLECMFSAYRSKAPTHLSSMPDLIKYQRGSSNDVLAAYFYNTLKGSGWVPNAQNVVTYADASLQPQLLQYIEFVFARFDANNDGGISAKEALRAFPIFKGLFMEVAKKDLEAGNITEADLPALFTYILKYGKPPAGIWEGLTRWYPWKNAGPEKWDVWADRGTMAGILAYISEQISGSSLITSPKANAPAPANRNRDSSGR